MSRALDALIAERVCGLSIGEAPEQQRSFSRYSADMNAAMRAVEAAGRWEVMMESSLERGEWCVEITMPGDWRSVADAAHPNPATALCLALLRAAGVDESKITAAMGGE